MTARTDFDRELAAWLVAERPIAAPYGLLETVVERVAETPRRPGWRVLDRWSWTQTAIRAASLARATLVAAMIVLLLLAIFALAALIGPPRPAPPFGLTTAGLIAVDTADGIVVGLADGTAREVIVPSAGGQAVSPTWSRDGLRLAFWERLQRSGPWSLVVVNPDGGGRQVLAEGISLKDREAGLAQPSNIAWSPDSRRLAFAADVESGGTSIFVAALGRPGATRITDPSLRGIDPAWAPGGEVIAFQSEANFTLHVVSPDGTNEHRLSTLADTFLWPDWSPDGTRLATTAGVGDESDIFIVSADGLVVTNISHNAAQEYSPSWSPDGRRLAWARVPIGGSDRGWVVVTDPGGPNLTEIRINADLAQPMWAPDGTRIFSYVQDADGSFKELVVLDPSGVAPVIRIPAAGNLGNGNWQRLP
jgi:dipeptidyl aminopeptidase/acylaminoacyl peptidase